VTPAVSIDKATKIYSAPRSGTPGVIAADGIELSIERGEVFGMLGPNGAGKTTTIGMCTARIRPTSGRITVVGVDVAAQPVRLKRAIGVVSQVNTLDRSCTVYENIYLHCRYFTMRAAPARRRTDELLERFQLTDRARALPSALSGGLAQRVQLARAVAHEPAVLFLDEPTAGLDPQSRLALWQLVRDLRATGVTVLLTTHHMEEADELCDRIAIVDHGRVLVVDSPGSLKRSLPRDPAATPAAPTLEAVFIQLTGRDLRE
jgi:ABC-2 type transport system ATP-binding protein